MAQRYIPTFEDWNANMSFNGSTDARGSAKYYNAFLKDMQNRPQYIDVIMAQHGMSKFNRFIEAPTAESLGLSVPEAPSAPSGPSAAEQKAEADRLKAESDEAARVKQGGVDRDAAFASYTGAASDATDYINSQITSEQSEADLSGVQYIMTEEMRQERINNQFASIYSEDDYSSLVDLYDEFGTPEGQSGYADFTTVRGVAAEQTANADSTESSASGGRTPAAAGNTLSTFVDETEEQLGSTSILGGG